VVRSTSIDASVEKDYEAEIRRIIHFRIT